MDILRAGLLVLTMTILQVELFANLRLFGVAAQCLLALSVAAGLTGGSWRGAILGFVAGLSIDLYLATPFGLSAFAYACAAAVVGLAEHSLNDTSRIGRAALVAAGSGLGATIYVVTGAAVGQTYLLNSRFLSTLLLVMFWNGLLGLVLVPVAKWIWDIEWSPRRRLLPGL